VLNPFPVAGHGVHARPRNGGAVRWPRGHPLSEGGGIGPEGGKAIAEALRVNAVLKKCNMKFNNLGHEAEAGLREVVKGKERFELLV
jgi:hypothetical protein